MRSAVEEEGGGKRRDWRTEGASEGPVDPPVGAV